MFRILAVVGCCAALLAACSPTFDWRPVAFGQDGAAGVLPDTPQAQTRPVAFEGRTLDLTMRSAQAGGVLFALGAAPLPPDWAADEPARRRLARWAVEALYRNAGAEPPGPDADPERRFSFEGRGPQGPVRVEAQVRVTTTEWLEAVVIAGPDDHARAPVDDFWLSLRWPDGAVSAGPGALPR
ncbi:hypothetical protein [Castellaniella defragrans]|uniref:Lipoprotein n=1 Tax=Castellaniella defragrans TaxID=75697 RepID=A0A7W9TRI8_CASDE|nr:hypothetical protein [Castellaniella defragrans]MBB6084688.1 hypothetical protein [Castellaniella defragrans]